MCRAYVVDGGGFRGGRGLTGISGWEERKETAEEPEGAEVSERFCGA
jgi:hypothetical protein